MSLSVIFDRTIAVSITQIVVRIKLTFVQVSVAVTVRSTLNSLDTYIDPFQGSSHLPSSIVRADAVLALVTSYLPVCIASSRIGYTHVRKLSSLVDRSQR